MSKELIKPSQEPPKDYQFDKYHPPAPHSLPPRPEEYSDIQQWQKDYDEWYRNQFGHCPNIAGHF